MKILFDIGHPAHVHYFKNLIVNLKNNGHTIIVIARDKDITFKLLRSYGIDFFSRGKGSNGLLGKIFYLFIGSAKVFSLAKKQNVDIFVSFASPYNALASIFYKKPVITIDDTEHNFFNHFIYKWLSSTILTPKSFRKEFGRSHMRFDATMEFAYLYKDAKIKNNRNIFLDNSKQNVILRLVSWNASHDVGHQGLVLDDVIMLISKIEPFANVYISSEKKLPENLKEYKLKISPKEIHNYMANSDIFIGESGSMATEAAFLGTHSIVLNSAAYEFGVFHWFNKFDNFYIASNFNGLLDRAMFILENKMFINKKQYVDEINKNGIDLTRFLIWFVENYPESKRIMKENPDYQYKFR